MTAVADELHQHLRHVARALVQGNVVPVLGAGANLCDRGKDEPWKPWANLPDGSELARWLVDKLEVEVKTPNDLLSVSQYAAVVLGSAPLYEKLHELFGSEAYPVPSLHRFLAELPQRLEDRGLPRRNQLIVTTNYDELMERGLAEAVGSFDVVRYLTTGRDAGHFVHEPRDGAEPQDTVTEGDAAEGEAGDHDAADGDPADAEPTPKTPRYVISDPRTYLRVSPETRPVLLKVHGGLCPQDVEHDSYVITEDDYVNYLMDTSPNQLIPSPLLSKLSNSHLLFLGYGMHDWNLRVLLQHISASRDLKWTWWAIQLKVGVYDRTLWTSRKVDLHQLPLSDYVTRLSEAVEGAMDKEVKEMEEKRGAGGRD